MSRAKLPLATIIKTAAKVMDKPRYGASLAMLQADRFMNTIHPRPQGRGGKIRQVSIRITDLCNLRCHTCGQWGDRGYLHDQTLAQLKKREVSPDRYIELLRDLHAKGHRPGVYLWGGEPMLYQGAIDVLEEAASLGMPCSIATNGSRLTDFAERLVAAPLLVVQVSVDGPTAEIHNASRPSAAGTQDNFTTVNQGIDALTELKRRRGKKLPLIASLCTINRRNYDRLVDVYHAFKNKVDVAVFYLAWWIDRQSADAHTVDFTDRFGFEPNRHLGWIGDWRPPDVAVLSDQLTQLVNLSGRSGGPAVVILPQLTTVDQLNTYYTDHSARFGYNRCVSIYSNVEINSNGDLSPCRDYHDYVIGNVKEKTITELWNTPAYTKFRHSLTSRGLMPVCTRCCGLMGY